MVLDPDTIQARCEALVGQVLGGRYRLDAVLGIGAMGAVFRAFHTGLERDVAVKLLHKDLMESGDMRARFAREAAAISKLDHPNCVRISDFGSDDDYQYLVMELLQGAALSGLLGKPLPPLRAIEITDEVLAGLEHAHGHGLVHRDIKPDNIFLAREDGGNARAKLVDFGIVKLQEGEGGPQLTKMGMIFGTPHFMSPEQATGGQVDARTDLYAVGIVLYMMLGGGLPFDSDDPLKVLRQQIRDAPPPLPKEVPDPLRELVGKLLAKKPEDRHASAAAAREALARVRKSFEVPVPVPVPAPIPAQAATPIPIPIVVPVPPPPTPPHAPGPMIVVPSGGGRSWWPPRWWPPEKRVQWLAGGVGGLVLLVAIVVASGDDEAEADAVPDEQAAAARSKMEALLGGKAAAAKEDDDEPGEADDDEPTPATEQPGEPSERALQANLASVDALIEARQYEPALIALKPLLAAHGGEAQLHWRMAKALTALGGAENRAAALDSHAAAISAGADLLDDEAFMAELLALMDDPKLRTAAVGLAIDQLGARADDRLVQWLNVQAKPLGYETRHRIIAHLQGHDRGDEINRPLQRALDLWQAREAEDPCEAFAAALDEASQSPDSFLVGTLRGIEVPKAAASEGAEPLACAGAAEKLAEARTEHDERFAGIDPVVPKAYRKRPASKSSQPSRKQRRR
jgi:hypothetical protein